MPVSQEDYEEEQKHPLGWSGEKRAPHIDGESRYLLALINAEKVRPDSDHNEEPLIELLIMIAKSELNSLDRRKLISILIK